MPKDIQFRHIPYGSGRPQIVLAGNGLERSSGQIEWDKLLEKLAVQDDSGMTEEEKQAVMKEIEEMKDKIPFPLLYELISSPKPAPAHLGQSDIDAQEKRLAEGLKEPINASNPLLDRLPSLGVDHIFTTNYSYCLEKAFLPSQDFSKTNVRSARRFNLNPERKGNNKPKREVQYRIHSGYQARNADGSPVGLWHIHGEASVSRGVVLGADRYGRMLSKIEQACAALSYDGNEPVTEPQPFISWPELFLFGDLYIIGFGFETCETDLWWLLRRKQRERFSDSRVYFYEAPDKTSVKQKLLLAHGAFIPCLTKDKPKTDADYQAFYELAFQDIQKRIEKAKSPS